MKSSKLINTQLWKWRTSKQDEEKKRNKKNEAEGCSRAGQKHCRTAVNHNEDSSEADRRARKTRAAKCACYQVKSKGSIRACWAELIQPQIYTRSVMSCRWSGSSFVCASLQAWNMVICPPSQTQWSVMSSPLYSVGSLRTAPSHQDVRLINVSIKSKGENVSE